MSFACADVSAEDSASETTKWDEFDVVFLAALVGMDTSSKLAILGSLARKLRPGALVVARSAKGLRSVLYPVSLTCMSCSYAARRMLTRLDTRAG